MFKTFCKGLILGVGIMCLSGCTDPQTARRVLTQNGYTDVRITGYNWLSCGRDDTYHTGFIAKSPNGSTVEGTVCGGFFFKNSTIRFE